MDEQLSEQGRSREVRETERKRGIDNRIAKDGKESTGKRRRRKYGVQERGQERALGRDRDIVRETGKERFREREICSTRGEKTKSKQEK